jgi:hypothetical protein
MRNFTVIPNQVFGESQLSIQSRYLYCVLLKHCGKNDFCFPSQITLGKILGCSDRNIRTLLAELIQSELISKQRRGWNRSNTYYVVKLLDTDRIPSSYHSGSKVPVHNETPVPPKSTYLKTKDNNKYSLKGLESCRRTLEEKGIKKYTTPFIKPRLNKSLEAPKSSLINKGNRKETLIF